MLRRWQESSVRRKGRALRQVRRATRLTAAITTPATANDASPVAAGECAADTASAASAAAFPAPTAANETSSATAGYRASAASDAVVPALGLIPDGA